MKKILIALALLTLSSSFAHGEESESEKIVADEGYVISLLRLCKDYAQEDEVAQTAMNAYLLTCINDDLELGYYMPIKVLPTENKQENESN